MNFCRGTYILNILTNLGKYLPNLILKDEDLVLIGSSRKIGKTQNTAVVKTAYKALTLLGDSSDCDRMTRACLGEALVVVARALHIFASSGE